MAVPCRVDTCRPWRRVWTWHAQGRQANVGRYDECLTAHGRTCECQIRLAPPHSLCAVACLMTPSLPQRADSCSSQPDWWRRRAPMSLLRHNWASDELDEAAVAGKNIWHWQQWRVCPAIGPVWWRRQGLTQILQLGWRHFRVSVTHRHTELVPDCSWCQSRSAPSCIYWSAIQLQSVGWVQWPMVVMQRSKSATDKRTSSILHWLSSANECSVTQYLAARASLSQLSCIQKKQKRTKHRALRHRTCDIDQMRIHSPVEHTVRPVRQVRDEPFQRNTPDPKTALKSQHEQLMVNVKSCR